VFYSQLTQYPVNHPSKSYATLTSTCFQPHLTGDILIKLLSYMVVVNYMPYTHSVFFYCAIHFSAKSGIATACHLSVVRSSVTLVDQDQDHISWKSWKLTARTFSLTPSLFVAQRPSTYLHYKGTWGNIGETRGGVGKSGVLKHKSGNISETHKDRGKVTMYGL